MFSVLNRLLPRRTAVRMAVVYASLTGLFVLLMFAVTLFRVKRYFYENAAQEILHESGEIQTLFEKSDLSLDRIEEILKGMTTPRKNNILDLSMLREDGSVFFTTRKLILEEETEKREYHLIEELGVNDVERCRFKRRKHTGLFLAFSVVSSDGTKYRCVFSTYPIFIVKGITNIKYILLWVFIGSLLFFSIVGFVLAKRTYRPIRRMIKKANEIGASNLSLRLEASTTGQELDDLALAFNDLFDRLQEAFRREQDFNSQVAHELRTPLTALRGHIESILLDETLDPQHRDALANAMTAADRLIALINHLLFLGRAGSGLKPRIKREKINLHTLVPEICELVFADEEERNNRLTIDISRSLDCLADREMLGRLILILVENANRHTPTGAEIVIRAARGNEVLRLEVMDRGKGIPESEREKIFDKFFSRIRDESEGTSNGAGLGLSIARSIARLHDGDLSCEETPGGGATFICTIPC